MPSFTSLYQNLGARDKRIVEIIALAVARENPARSPFRDAATLEAFLNACGDEIRPLGNEAYEAYCEAALARGARYGIMPDNAEALMRIAKAHLRETEQNR